MTTSTKTAVTCNCCRKARSAHIIKDCGFKVYPACKGCIRIMSQNPNTTPIIIR